MLLKLGKAVEGGVGPDGDIVGFSTVCPHKGFPLTYNAESKTHELPRPLLASSIARRAASRPGGRPRRTCRNTCCAIDDKGDIYAEGVDELLYGRLSNVL